MKIMMIGSCFSVSCLAQTIAINNPVTVVTANAYFENNKDIPYKTKGIDFEQIKSTVPVDEPISMKERGMKLINKRKR
jgi:hypothetical protein